MYDYIAVSTAVSDDLHLADGTHIGVRLGGAGIYAFSGIRLWTESVLQVTGVGEDFSSTYGDWFVQNRCSMEGLLVKDPHTAVSNVQYFPDGERVETPRYGGDHYRKLEATPAELEPFLRTARGVYIFKDMPAGYWDAILTMKKQYGFTLEWELNADVACPACREQVRAIACQCDILSLNRTEARHLFGTEDMEEATAALEGWNIPLVYLRMGGDGARVLSAGRRWDIPCVKNVAVEDPTGAGNSSSGGVLYGWCRGESPLLCGIRGAISAARCIEQYGPPDFSPEKTVAAVALAESMLQELSIHAEK